MYSPSSHIEWLLLGLTLANYFLKDPVLMEYLHKYFILIYDPPTYKIPPDINI